MTLVSEVSSRPPNRRAVLAAAAVMATGGWAQQALAAPERKRVTLNSVLPFDTSTWQRLVDKGPRPAAYIFTTTYCPSCPEAFDRLFAHIQATRKMAELVVVLMDVQGAKANELDGMLPLELREERRARFMAVAEEVSIQKLKSRIGARMQVLIDSSVALGKKGGVGRTYADAPEIDGVVHLLPPEKISKQLKVGEFTQVRIVGTQGHDLIGQPV